MISEGKPHFSYCKKLDYFIKTSYTYIRGFMSEKRKKILSVVIITCFVIIIVEVILMAGYKLSLERNVNRLNSISDIAKIDNGYIAVGLSDFHNSHFINEEYYDYTDETSNEKQRIITTQARIAKYDENLKVVWENTIKAKYDSAFNSVLVDDDGYVAVGSFAKDIEQVKANTQTAIIVKYDKTGKLMWKNTYSNLSDTKFNKVIKDGDNYIVIGQSIYENLEMGNHITGGGIIVRYNNKGEILEWNNYGGNKSGTFNDIISVDDGYIVCGKDAVNYGVVVKFSKDFQREVDDTNLISKKVLWNKTYSNTDNTGFTSMLLVDDVIYTVGAVNVSNDKDDSGNTIFKYDAAIVKYDLTGKYLETITLNDSVHHQFNSIISNGKELYLSMLIDVDSYYDGENKRSRLLKFDLENKKFSVYKEFDGDNDYIINKLAKLNKKYYYIGTSNDKCTIRGCDYQSFIELME